MKMAAHETHVSGPAPVPGGVPDAYGGQKFSLFSKNDSINSSSSSCHHSKHPHIANPGRCEAVKIRWVPPEAALLGVENFSSIGPPGWPCECTQDIHPEGWVAAHKGRSTALRS